MPAIKKILLYTVALLANLTVLGAKQILIPEHTDRKDLVRYADFYIDSSATQSLEDILSPDVNIKFQQVNTREYYTGYDDHVIWVRMQFANILSEPVTCYLAIPYPMIHTIEAHSFGLKSNYQYDIKGYWHQDNSSSESTMPIFPVNLRPQEIKTVYLMFYNNGIEFPLQFHLLSANSLLDYSEKKSLLFGISYGLILFIAIIQILLFLYLRKRIFPFFIFYVLFVGLYFAIRDGTAFKYLWSNWPELSEHSLLFGPQLPIIFLLAMTQTALKMKTYLPRMHRVFNALIYADILLVLVSLFTDFASCAFCNATVVICIIPILWVSFWSIRFRNLVLPKYFLSAMMVLTAGIVLLLMKNFGLVTSQMGELGFRIGFLSQMIILSIGLTVMFKKVLKKKDREAIENLQRLNQLKDNANNKLESLAAERTKELAEKNTKLTNTMRELAIERDIFQVQRDLIKKKTDETTDSIKYAQVLQASLEQGYNHLMDDFSGWFLMDWPKAIVSGDFFWVRKIESTILLAISDCTGHGVPGAFMSVLGITYLNSIVNFNKETAPDKILFELRKMIISSFSANSSASDITKDGMDIAIVSINLETKELQYSGAYNPLYLVRDTELVTFSADKMPISADERQNMPFTLKKIELRPEDTLYLFSDGYVDQFGWRTGKKFKHKQFKQLLLELNDVPIEGQKLVLERTMKNWIGDTDQVDDIMVLGVKI